MIETCQQYVDRRLSEGWKVCGRFLHTVILSPPDGAFLRPVDLRNDTETLRPNAAGDETTLSYGKSGCTDNWQCVDEASADDWTSRVGTNSSTYERDLYNLPASSGSGTINFIEVYIRTYTVYYGAGKGKPSIKSDSTVTDGTELTLADSWHTYSQQWSTNPADTGAWEWSDIDDLQIGVSLKDLANAGTYITQVYVEVDYTAAAGLGIPIAMHHYKMLGE